MASQPQPPAALRLARAGVAALMVVGRRLWPYLIGIAVTATSLLAVAVRGALSRRRGLAMLGARVLWWGALASLFVGGKLLLGTPAIEIPVTRPLWLLGGGLAACLTVVGIGAERRMRWAAFVLGVAHAGLGLLAWTVLHG